MSPIGPKRTFVALAESPLSGVKQTSPFDYAASASDPKRTCAANFLVTHNRNIIAGSIPRNGLIRLFASKTTVTPLGWHGRQIETNRHVLDQFFLRDMLLYL